MVAGFIPEWWPVFDRNGGRLHVGIRKKLLAAICEGRVGAMFAIEVSRLARNGRDEDGIYEPRHPNDRLLLHIADGDREEELAPS
ncbi:hypothetical protein X747_32845 [Mesorhizobium sp. LNJC384A00]|nr:hypothetical protein X747_32845 [Mesorhizobium sp. LNJC384A00]